MGKSPKRHCKQRVTGGSLAEASAANEYTASTSGLQNVLFTRGTTRDAVRFTDTLNKLARHVGIQAWSQSTVTAKAIIEMVAPSWTEPAKPIRMYNLPVTQGDPVSTPRAQTTESFADGTMDRNIKVADNIDWKMTLSEWS